METGSKHGWKLLNPSFSWSFSGGLFAEDLKPCYTNTGLLTAAMLLMRQGSRWLPWKQGFPLVTRGQSELHSPSRVHGVCSFSQIILKPKMPHLWGY